MSAGRDLRDEAAEAIYRWWDASGAPQPFERLSFDRKENYREAADAVLAVVEPRIRAEALRRIEAVLDLPEHQPASPLGEASFNAGYLHDAVRAALAASTGEGDRRG